MIYFLSDYSSGACPEVLDALVKTNAEHTDGYGLDPHCERAARIIRNWIGREDCGVYTMIGGTPCNVTVAACLRPYEAIVAARTGHAYFHETGAVEATGHRVVTADGIDGKLTPDLVASVLVESQDEHTPLARLVYVSQPTECGTIYSKAELTALYAFCREKGLLLYIDGARLGCALTCGSNDVSMKELASLCDAFYIGGTKNGALFGEALVIFDPGLNDHFRWMIKRQNGLLAKGRLIGVQFEALLEGEENSVYFKNAAHANAMADKLRAGLTSLGVSFYGNSPTNQLFPVLPRKVVTELSREFAFYEWLPEKDGLVTIRLVTGWDTEEKSVDAFLARAAKLLK